MSEINALEHMVERERSYCWMFGEHMDDPCPCGWASKDSAYSQLVALKTEIADLRSARDEMRVALETYEYAIREAEAILGGEYAMEYEPFFEMVKSARAVLAKYPKEQK
jgi:hypothetical protein